MRYADVAVAAPTHASFTYAIPDEMSSGVKPGVRAAVPFGRRTAMGYVLGTTDELPSGLDEDKVRAIRSVLDEDPVFSANMLSWLRWMSSYYCAPIGEVCRTALPARLNRLSSPKTSRPTLPREMEHLRSSSRMTLTDHQRDAIASIENERGKGGTKPFLLHGITGSGKTEIYLNIFETMKREGMQSLLLVPEIGLTPQLSHRIVERFGDEVALYHSGLTDAQRHHQWERMRDGDVSVVVGTRSALFAPLKKLGAIVVDEEHDSSYKQEEGVLYHARDAAVMRGHLDGAVVVLGSATPSVESFANARSGKYRYIHLPERTGGGALPDVEIVDMRHEVAREKAADPEAKGHQRGSLSRELVDVVGRTLERGEQSMIFLNRRGFAHFIICEECGHTFECPNCNISLSYHRRPARMLCHYCDYAIAPPKTCPGCGGVDMVPMGRGTERLEQELRELFPEARVARLDRDSIANSRTRNAVFKGMREGKIDILVGTQMIAKGHDFPNITTVGIVSADVALHLPDFRSAERTFQLITQVSGRAGRTSHGARVILQTYQPEHPSLKSARSHDYASFYEEEGRQREMLGYPPFSRLANVRISATDAAKADAQAHSIAKALKAERRKRGFDKAVMLLGPAPAPMEKVRNRYRWQLLIKARTAKDMGAYLASVHPRLREFEAGGVRIAVDVDPVSML
jgi:primosomal protein N' (replication factor Y)